MERRMNDILLFKSIKNTLFIKKNLFKQGVTNFKKIFTLDIEGAPWLRALRFREREGNGARSAI